MPLLIIVGVSCFNTSFYVGFAFLEKDDVENYIWALNGLKGVLGHENQPYVIMLDRELALINAVKNVFSSATNLLCVWHIEKNVLANCQKYFEHIEDFDKFMLSWNNLVYSTTEVIFVKTWGEFELLYRDKKNAIEYIKSVWLPCKENFVSAWTEKYLHFGMRSSSRVEGAHAKLKKYLQVSTGGFQEVKYKIWLAIQHEYNETKVQLASEKIQVPHDCNTHVFRDLLYHVSLYALKDIYKQYVKIKDGTTTPCTGHFMATMGLPCVHKIKSLGGKVLPLELIHPQWRINTLSLNFEDSSRSDGDDKVDKLLDEFQTKYKTWPLNKKEFAISMITKLVNETGTFFEPVIQRPKRRPPKYKKKKGKTSTTRDPSRFEYVESSQKHGPSSSASIFQQTNEDVNEFSLVPPNNTFDLNAYPGLFHETMMFE